MICIEEEILFERMYEYTTHDFLFIYIRIPEISEPVNDFFTPLLTRKRLRLYRIDLSISNLT